MHRGGWKTRHPDEEVAWMRNEIKGKEGQKFGRKLIKQLRITERFNHQFGKNMNVDAAWAWLRKLSLGNKCDKKQDLLKVLEQAKYILYIFNEGVFGYDSKDEVKAALSQKQTQVPVRLFENIPAEIKISVEVLI